MSGSSSRDLAASQSRQQHSTFLGWAVHAVEQGAIDDQELFAFAEAIALVQKEKEDDKQQKKKLSASAEGGLFELFRGSAGLLWALLAAVCDKRPLRPRGISAKPNARGGAGANFAGLGVIEHCLNHLTEQEGVRLVNIGASDLQEGNDKLVLGFLWTLIRRYSLAEVKADEFLQWVNRTVTEFGLVDNVPNFKTAWSDGRAFAALTNAAVARALGAAEAKQHAIEFPAEGDLSRAESLALLNKAFETARDVLRIPLLLKAELVYDSPDDLAIQTYVSFFRTEEGPAEAKRGTDPKLCLAELDNFLLDLVPSGTFTAGKRPVDGQSEAQALCKTTGCHDKDARGTVRSAVAEFVRESSDKSAASEKRIAELERALKASQDTSDKRNQEAEKRITELEAALDESRKGNQSGQKELAAQLEDARKNLKVAEAEVAKQRGLVVESAETIGSLLGQVADLQSLFKKMKKSQVEANNKLMVIDLKSQQEAASSDPNQIPPHYNEIEAPDCDREDAESDTVTLCFTDVQDSTVQWEKYPELMAESLKLHNRVIRGQIAEYRGYEVKTEGDAFMVAFGSPETAVAWAISVQRELEKAEWPSELLQPGRALPASAIDEKLRFRGLRVRTGIHSGKPQAERDPVTGRMDYFGRMVNKSARVEGLAGGGQIVISEDTKGFIEGHDLVKEGPPPAIIPMGSFALKGLPDETEAFMVLADEHRAREKLPKAAEPVKSVAVTDMLSSLRTANDMLKKQLQDAQSQLDAAKASIADFCTKLSDADGGQNPALAAALSVAERFTMAMDDEDDALDGSDDDNMLEDSLEKLRAAQAELKAREKEFGAISRANDGLESDIQAARRRLEEAERLRREAEAEAMRLAERAGASDHWSCVKLKAEIEQRIPIVDALAEKAAVLAAAIANPTNPDLLAAVHAQNPGIRGPINLTVLRNLAKTAANELQAAKADLQDVRMQLANAHTHEADDAEATLVVSQEEKLQGLVKRLLITSTATCPVCEVRHDVMIPAAMRQQLLGQADADDALATTRELHQLFDVMMKIRRALIKAKGKGIQTEAQTKALTLLSSLIDLLGGIERSQGNSLYHKKCFRCSEPRCGVMLSSEAKYGYTRRNPAEGIAEKPFCAKHAPRPTKAGETPRGGKHNKGVGMAHRQAERCDLCRQEIRGGESFVRTPAEGGLAAGVFHDDCLYCSNCGNTLQEYGVVDGQRMCIGCLPDDIVDEIEGAVDRIREGAIALAKLQKRVSVSNEFMSAQHCVTLTRALQQHIMGIDPTLIVAPAFLGKYQKSLKDVLVKDDVLRYKFMSQDVLIYAKEAIGAVQVEVARVQDLGRARRLRMVAGDLATALETAVTN